MQRILITGITGKTGEPFLKKMMTNAIDLYDYQFRVLVRESSDTKLLDLAQSSLNIEQFVGSLEDSKMIKQFCFGYNTLIHIAGIKKSLEIVRIAVDNGVNRIILVHTTGIYSKYKAAGDEYKQIETAITEYLVNKSVSLTVLRPTMIYGNLRDHNVSVFISMVDRLRLFPVINKAQYALQPVWCKDLGEAYYDVLMNPQTTANHEYILSGGQVLTLREMLEEISRQLDVKNCFVPFPYWVAILGAWLIYLCTLKKRDYREKVQRLVEPRAYSHEDATRDFGYRPVSFSIGITDEIIEYKHIHKIK